MNKIYFFSGTIACAMTICTYGVMNYLDNSDQEKITIEHINKSPAQSAVYTLDDNKIVPLDFTQTAEDVVDAVVHIKATQLNDRAYQPTNNRRRALPDPFKHFFGDDFDFFFNQPQRPNNQYQSRNPAKVGAGSGVIVSEDGYIITNNHVIDGADDIEVTLYDNRTYKAKVIGTDPTTDLALIQIKESELPKISFLDSDEVKIGEWVLAVGNPFSLNSTITAGIVSAKGRSINILKEQYAIEDFIQTDAAINPGNSGGALVNLDGGLIGINTAIASPTGVYSGYGFAVPSNIVHKVMIDLMKYGSVQRGLLGVMIRTVDGNLAKRENLDIVKGVYVDSIMSQSAAGAAGVKPGDVILKVNDVDVNSSPELQGMIARYRPGEKVQLTVYRDHKEHVYDVVLTNKEGTKTLGTISDSEVLNILGVELEELSEDEAEKLSIDSGIRITKLYPGLLRRNTQVREGFIITHLDGKKIDKVDELTESLENKNGGVMIEGIYEDLPGEYYYAFGI